jgi:SAM-dependent methyltransferase
MQATFSCPVCESQNWRTAGHRLYRASDADGMSPYLRKRFAVLFELWNPAQVEFLATFIICEQCGFCCYAPRPTEAELETKYQYLISDIPGDVTIPVDSPIELRRAENVCRELHAHLKSGSRVLDFGGGDGRIMCPLVSQGCECFVVDYCSSQVSGVHWLGNTLADVPKDQQFDAIFCSHVIEHLANPLAVLIELREHLSSNGVMYVEVPMELWRNLPAKEEPVTHINFFTSGSLRSLFERAGFQAMYCRHKAYTHPSGHRATVVQALCQSSKRPVAVHHHGARPTQLLLNPRLPQRIRQAWIHRDMTLCKFAAKFI